MTNFAIGADSIGGSGGGGSAAGGLACATGGGACCSGGGGVDVVAQPASAASDNATVTTELFAIRYPFEGTAALLTARRFENGAMVGTPPRYRQPAGRSARLRLGTRSSRPSTPRKPRRRPSTDVPPALPQPRGQPARRPAGTDWWRAPRRSSRERSEGPRSRLSRSRSVRCAIAGLAGSTAAAKRRFASVYSCPQYTRVSRRQRGELAKRRPHLLRRALEQLAAARREQRIAAEHDRRAVHAADVRDMPRGMSGDVEHVERVADAARRRPRRLPRARACARESTRGPDRRPARRTARRARATPPTWSRW